MNTDRWLDPRPPMQCARRRGTNTWRTERTSSQNVMNIHSRERDMLWKDIGGCRRYRGQRSRHRRNSERADRGGTEGSKPVPEEGAEATDSEICENSEAEEEYSLLTV